MFDIIIIIIKAVLICAIAAVLGIVVLNIIKRKKLFLKHVMKYSDNSLDFYSRSFSNYNKPDNLLIGEETEKHFSFFSCVNLVSKKKCVFVFGDHGTGKTELLKHFAFNLSKKIIPKVIKSSNDFGVLFIRAYSNSTVETVTGQINGAKKKIIVIDGLDSLFEPLNGFENQIGKNLAILEKVINSAATNNAKKIILSLDSCWSTVIPDMTENLKFPITEKANVAFIKLPKPSSDDMATIAEGYISNKKYRTFYGLHKIQNSRQLKNEKIAVRDLASHYCNNGSVLSLPQFSVYLPLILNEKKAYKFNNNQLNFSFIEYSIKTYLNKRYYMTHPIEPTTEEREKYISKSQGELLRLVSTNIKDGGNYASPMYPLSLISGFCLFDGEKTDDWSLGMLFEKVHISPDNTVVSFSNTYFYWYFLIRNITSKIKDDTHTFLSAKEFLESVSFLCPNITELYYEHVFDSLKDSLAYSSYDEYRGKTKGDFEIVSKEYAADVIFRLLPEIKSLKYNSFYFDENTISHLIDDSELIVDTNSDYIDQLVGSFSEKFIKTLTVINSDFMDSDVFFDVFASVAPEILKITTDDPIVFNRVLPLGEKKLCLNISDFSPLYFDIADRCCDFNENTTQISVDASTEKSLNIDDAYPTSGPIVTYSKPTACSCDDDCPHDVDLLAIVLITDYKSFPKITSDIVKIGKVLLSEITETQNFSFFDSIRNDIAAFYDALQQYSDAENIEYEDEAFLFLEKYADILKICEKNEEALEQYSRLYNRLLKFDRNDERTNLISCDCGYCLFDLERYSEANEVLSKSYDWFVDTKVDNKNANDCRYYYARTLLKLGEYEIAFRLLREVCAWDKKYDPTAAYIVERNYVYGSAAYQNKFYDEAFVPLKFAFDNTDYNSECTAASNDIRFLYAKCLLRSEYYSDAEPLLRKSFDFCFENAPDSEETNKTRFWYGACLYHAELFESALHLFRSAYEWYIKRDIENRITNVDRYWYGLTLLKLGCFDAALPLLREAFLRLSEYSDDDAYLNNRRYWYGQCLFELTRYKEAAALLKQAYLWYEDHGINDYVANNRRYWYALCLFELNRYREAMALVKTSYEWMEDNNILDSVYYDRKFWYGRCLFMLERYERAYPMLKDAYYYRKENDAEDSEILILYKQTYVSCLKKLGKFSVAEYVEFDE